MHRTQLRFRRLIMGFGLGAAALTAVACSTPQQNFALGASIVALVGGRTPAQEIEQVFYLGVFDPQEQLPPTVYRLTVHGQASLISQMKFGSGWVPANLIDSLNSNVGFNKDTGNIEITKGPASELSELQTGRRLVLFGPEGFREAPKDHRLVMIMGASPEAFFSAIDESVGVIAQAQRELIGGRISNDLFRALVKLRSERERLAEIARDVSIELRTAEEVAKP